MFGILNVNKPVGWTSRDVVNRVQGLVRPAKAGHAGTLDPLATGVLVVCVGQATRLIAHVQQLPKVYEATFQLGRTSPSEDVETEITEIVAAPQPTLAEIKTQLPRFVGAIQQRPPIFSALKVQGKRAYQLARAGETVELAPRTVEIYELQVVDFNYPELQLSMRCGSGTYVRSVGRDLAESLGTGAVMSQLTRKAIGDFFVGDALDLEQLDSDLVRSSLVSPLAAVSHLPRLRLDESQLTEIQHGRLISASEVGKTPTSADGPSSAEDVFTAVDSQGQLVGLLREKRPGLIGAVCNFSQSL